ncbi:MAG: glycosyltransferase family 9 protein [Prevotellaceae bacterium]|jgi:ADP-heptose:LPS heptosyltransferase|nr:glycosyltransferase family 9 protein [Prevotellaceae bacterium]
MENNPKRVLVIRLSAMGDVAIVVPVLYSIKRKYPEAELFMLSNMAFVPFFEKLESVTFIGIKTKDYKGLKGLYRLYKELKVYNFDLVADLHNVIRSKIIRMFFKLSGVKVTVINKGRKEKHAFTRQKNKKLLQLKTSAERYADVFRKSGFPVSLAFKSIYSKDYAVSDKVSSFLNNAAVAKIGIAPFAMYTGKIYPIERMEKIVAHFDKMNIAVFLFGGGDKEKNLLAQWNKKYTHCTSIVGQLSLREELQLINRLDVMLTMDSGNMHLASLVNTPVVSVWGATHPFAGFYGWGQKMENVVQTDLYCRPCSVYGNKPCYRKDYACMEMITPEMIIEKIKRYI